MQQINNEDYPIEEIAKQKITEYITLYEYDSYYFAAINNLNKRVNKYIQNGWQPFGGVSISGDGTFVAAQAMVKIKNVGE